MSKKVFVSIAYKSRETFASELQAIVELLTSLRLAPTVFVREYQFAPGEYQEMMQTALRHIRESDLLIAEVSHKVIGVGIEIGYAVALNIPIVYLRKISAPHSTTVGGVADCTISYENLADLKNQLRHQIPRLLSGG